MISDWSSNRTQRSTRASSISSLSTKIRLATASLVSGHSLSAGCSSGEPEGRNSGCIPGNLGPPAVVPPGPVHHQQDALVFARSHRPGQLKERHREQLYVYRGQDQPENLPALGPQKP